MKTKLLNIKNFSNKKKLKKLKPSFYYHLNTSGSNSVKKNNLKTPKIIRGNSFIEQPVYGKKFDLNKRINEKNAVYSLSQWKKDFKKNRVYKKISCEYPSINFVAKPKRKFKHNYAFSPTHNHNIFNEIRFKPFESFDNDDSKGNNSFNKKKKKKRNFMMILHKNK